MPRLPMKWFEASGPLVISSIVVRTFSFCSRITFLTTRACVCVGVFRVCVTVSMSYVFLSLDMCVICACDVCMCVCVCACVCCCVLSTLFQHPFVFVSCVQWCELRFDWRGNVCVYVCSMCVYTHRYIYICMHA